MKNSSKKPKSSYFMHDKSAENSPLKSPKKEQNTLVLSKSQLNKSRKFDSALKDLNSLVPDFLQGKPSKASRQIFEIKSKEVQKLPENNKNLDIEERNSLDDSFSNIEYEEPKDFRFIEENLKEVNDFPNNPLEYYQNFKVSNLNKIESLDPHQYMTFNKNDDKAHETFLSEEEVLDAKFVNFDKENIETLEKFYQDLNEQSEKFGVVADRDSIIEIDVLVKDFQGLNEKGFENYDKILINVEEYDNIVNRKNQNHASFAYISLTFLKKMLKKFLEGCHCLEDFLKAERVLPQISYIFTQNFQKNVKQLKSSDLLTQDLEVLLNPEGSFYPKIGFFSQNLQSLQKIINQAKILLSSISSSKKFEMAIQQNTLKMREDEIKLINSRNSNFMQNDNQKSLIKSSVKEKQNNDDDFFAKTQKTEKSKIFIEENNKNSKINSVTFQASQNFQTFQKSQNLENFQINENFGNFQKYENSRMKFQNLNINTLEILQTFVDMKNLLINMLNINFKQNFSESNLKSKLQEKEEALNEKIEREINYKKSDEIFSFVTKTWNLFSQYKDIFINLEMKYLKALKDMIYKSEICYYKYFTIWQKLSFSMESLRKLCQLNLEEIRILELETKEILEKSIIKIQYPLLNNQKENNKVLDNIKEKQDKLIKKAQKLKKESKHMRKSLKNEYFYMLYMQKLDETLIKVSQIQYQLKAFSEILRLIKEFQSIESIINKENIVKNNEKNTKLDAQDIKSLKSKKTQYLNLYQTLMPYKNRISNLKKNFPSFFEIEKELNREINSLDLRLKRINDVLEGKNPEIIEWLDSEIQITEKLVEKLKEAINIKLSLKEFLKAIEKHPSFESELASKANTLERLGFIHGIENEKKQKLLELSDEIHQFQTVFLIGRIVLKIIDDIKPEKVKKLFNGIDLKAIFEEVKTEEKFEVWSKDIEHHIGILYKKDEIISKEILKKDNFLNNLSVYKDIFILVLNDYLENLDKFKKIILNQTEYQTRLKALKKDIDNTIQKIDLNENISEFFIPVQNLKVLIEKYINDTLTLLGNQSNSLIKLNRKNKAAEYRDILETFKENFLAKGIKAHTEEKFNEMTRQLKNSKSLRNEIKAEVLQQQKNPKENSSNYTLGELRDIVGSLNIFIKVTMLMISLGGLNDIYLIKLFDIKIAFQKQDEDFALNISQKIKEIATDLHKIKKKMKSSKPFLTAELGQIYLEAMELVELTIEHLRIIYEQLGDLNNFDGIFNENGFEINAKSYEFYEGLMIFLNFNSNYHSKKKELIENRQKLAMKLKNPELQEFSKPLEGINIQFFKIIEKYSEEFDFDYLRFLEPKLKLINEKNILSVSKEVFDVIENFYSKIKEDMKNSFNIFKELSVDLPKVSQKIKTIQTIFESDLSYKGFIKNATKKINTQATKMLIVEGLSECKNLFQKEKLNSWDNIITNFNNILQIYFKDKTDNNLQSLSEYKKMLFTLKKVCHNAQKEMAFINSFEELLSYDYKISENV